MSKSAHTTLMLQRPPSPMAHGMDDDLGVRDLVEDQVGIGRRRQASDRRVFRALADEGVSRKLVDQGLDALPNAAGPLGRPRVEVPGKVPQVGKGRRRIAQLHKP